MRTRDEVAANDVFSKFRDYYSGGESRSITRIMDDIHNVGRVYREIEEASNPDLKRFLRRWKIMQQGALTPVLLWLLSSEVSQRQMEKGIRALESHLVRRMICRISGQGYNLLMIRLVDTLEEEGKDCAGDTIIAYLKRQTGNFGLWPKNDQLEEILVNQPLYKLLTRNRLRMVLESMEEELRTPQTESQSIGNGLTIEHVMPQKWQRNWPLPTDVGDEGEAEERRDRLVHSIGNLTLVSQRLNPTLSNSPWSRKRQEIERHSVLFLNKMLIENAHEIWDESAIIERGRRLYQVATRVWPDADSV